MDITIHDFACKYQPKSVPPIQQQRGREALGSVLDERFRMWMLHHEYYIYALAYCFVINFYCYSYKEVSYSPPTKVRHQQNRRAFEGVEHSLTDLKMFLLRAILSGGLLQPLSPLFLSLLLLIVVPFHDFYSFSILLEC